MDAPGRFGGFGPEALAFLAGLAHDNSKRYFDANREVYEEHLALPMRALVVDLGDRLADGVSPAVQAEPKVGRSLFRINRDLRFSKDTTPYHPYVDAVFWEGPSPRSSPSFILRIAADEVVVGAGVVGLDKTGLARWRASVIDDSSGSALVATIGAVQQAVPGAALSAPTRARVPRGFPADHPRADLLRSDGLHVSASVEPPPTITDPCFTEWLVDRYVRFAPLHRWLVDHVG